MKKPLQRTRKYYAPQNEQDRCCDHPGCTENGEFRAPKNRKLKEYYWFCLKHVQEYNQKWNYYDGVEGADDEEKKRSHMRFRWFGSKIKYSFGDEFVDEYDAFRRYDYAAMNEVYFTEEERRCIKIMELNGEEGLSVEIVKKQYKLLVKKYHPDVNQGDKNAEEKFKLLVNAYNLLLAKLS